MRTAFQVSKGLDDSDQQHVDISWKGQSHVGFGYRTVDVSGATGVVTGECGLEVNKTVGVTLLDTAEES